MMLIIAELPGNPFLNFLMQSLVEFPAYFIGQRLCKYIQTIRCPTHYAIEFRFVFIHVPVSHSNHPTGNSIGRRLTNSLTFSVASVLSLGLVFVIIRKYHQRHMHTRTT